MIAFATVHFNSAPLGWTDLVNRTHHYFFCQVRGTSRWTVNGKPSELPAGFGMWLPIGTTYSAQFDDDDVIWAIEFDPSRPATSRAGVVHIDDELEDLLTQFSNPMVVRADAETNRSRIFDVVDRLVRTPAGLELPANPAARAIAERLLVQPGNRWSTDDWARWAHLSTRSLQRIFRAETGMTFSAWRLECRIWNAERHLRRGSPVRSVARLVGYDDHSAFTRAFRRRVGHAPSQIAASGQPMRP